LENLDTFSALCFRLAHNYGFSDLKFKKVPQSHDCGTRKKRINLPNDKTKSIFIKVFLRSSRARNCGGAPLKSSSADQDQHSCDETTYKYSTFHNKSERQAS
jgi:hypothetical protein